MKKVLVNKPIHAAAIQRLAEEVQVLTPFAAPATQVIEMMEGVHGLVLCAGLNVTGQEMERWHALQVIGRHGAGLDFVDIQAATQRGLPVVYTPGGPTESAAEHTLLLILAAARRLPLLDRATRAGNFAIRDQIVGLELQGMTLGVVGFGRIGQRVASMCRDALGMSVYVFDPYLPRSIVEEWGATCVATLKELAGIVDVLTIHCPLNSDTRHILSAEIIGAMQPGAILINTSRGPIVEEPALVQALREERLGGAGLDVYDPEPPDPLNPLFTFDNVVLTPHLASFTEQGRRRMGMMVVEDVLRVLREEKPLFLANPQVLTMSH
ncbi:MAG: hydroxyacid dehydrogenase [Chloroflexi bacterium]|nr:hydroxyacid dehydrogenase [Chloroflexota bacterium]